MKAYGGEDLIDKRHKATACERGKKRKRALRKRARRKSRIRVAARTADDIPTKHALKTIPEPQKP